MKYIVLILFTLVSFSSFSAEKAPFEVIAQESFSNQIRFELPYYSLSEVCQDSACKVNGTVQVGSSEYSIYEIYIGEYETGLTWNDIFAKKISVSIKMKENTTSALYNLFINLTPETPCFIGENQRLYKSRVFCTIKSFY